MGWVGKDLKDRPVPPSGRDTYHESRMLKAPTNLNYRKFRHFLSQGVHRVVTNCEYLLKQR